LRQQNASCSGINSTARHARNIFIAKFIAQMKLDGFIEENWLFFLYNSNKTVRNFIG
jgi:hypothetical protein